MLVVLSRKIANWNKTHRLHLTVPAQRWRPQQYNIRRERTRALVKYRLCVGIVTIPNMRMPLTTAETLRAWILSALVVQQCVGGNPDAKRLYDDLLSNYNKLGKLIESHFWIDTFWIQILTVPILIIFFLSIYQFKCSLEFSIFFFSNYPIAIKFIHKVWPNNQDQFRK